MSLYASIIVPTLYQDPSPTLQQIGNIPVLPHLPCANCAHPNDHSLAFHCWLKCNVHLRSCCWLTIPKGKEDLSLHSRIQKYFYFSHPFVQFITQTKIIFQLFVHKFLFYPLNNQMVVSLHIDALEVIINQNTDKVGETVLWIKKIFPLLNLKQTWISHHMILKLLWNTLHLRCNISES